MSEKCRFNGRLWISLWFCSLAGMLMASPVETDSVRRQRKFDYFFYEGLKLKQAAQYDAAFDLFNHCLALDSTDAAVRYELCMFYMQLNKPEKAIEVLKPAVALRPDQFEYRMAYASISRSLGMFGEAAEAYRELVKDFPQKKELNYYLADALTQAGEVGEAIDALDALEERVGMNEALSMQKYRLYNQLEQPAEAFKEIEKLAAKFPMEARYPLIMGDLHLEKKEMEQALACYQKAHEIDPTNPYYIVSMANYYEANGEKEAAEEEIKAALVNEKLDVETKVSILSRYILRLQQSKQGIENANHLFETLLEQHPEDTELKLMYGGLLMAQEKEEEARFQFQLKKEMDQALTCYQKAHEIDPTNPYYIVSMANYYEANGEKEAAEEEIKAALVNEKLDVETKVSILSRYILRLQQSKQGIENANHLFETLLEQHPEDTELKLMYGGLLMAQEKEEEARFQFQLVTEMDPSQAEAWKRLLNIALKQENMSEVERICTACMELFPNAPEYYFYLGIAYFQQENYQASLSTYYAGLSVIPKENPRMKSDFYGQIGDIYHQLNQMDQAYKAYEEALKYNEQNVVVLNNYSYFLSLEKRDLKRAERMSAQCIRLEPDNATYLDTYAWIFFVQGNYTLAKIYIENALSKDTTNSSELVDHYGDILFMNGEKEKAVEQWKKAKEMGKESQILDRKIAEQNYIEE